MHQEGMDPSQNRLRRHRVPSLSAWSDNDLWYGSDPFESPDWSFYQRARIGTAKRLKQTKERKKEKRKKGRRQTTKMTTTTITGARTRGKSKVDTRQEQGHGPLRGARRTDHPNESSPRSSSCPFPWCSARPTVGGRKRSEDIIRTKGYRLRTLQAANERRVTRFLLLP